MKTASPKYINVKGQLIDLSTPQVMGILNLTPDSFFADSRIQTEEKTIARVQQILDEGGTMIDVGAYSSRPDGVDISADEEMERLATGLSIINKHFPDVVISVDTFRADVAARCVEEFGVGIINDIAGGELDDKMFETVARLQVPYIMMHMRGTPQTMQQHTHYDNFLKEIFLYFAQKTTRLRQMGVNDIILDPGFGFAKTIEQNYELLAQLQDFDVFDLPVLVGVSRKSMIYKMLGTTPAEALNGTTALNTISLMKGANILRVHDVKEAVEAVKIWQMTTKYQL